MTKSVGFFRAFTAEGCRDAMRLSYAKHRALSISSGENEHNAHYAGLFGALGTRYKTRELIGYKTLRLLPSGVIPDVVLWPELAPFLMMNEEESVEALAEYVLWQEKPRKSRNKWLSEKLKAAVALGMSDPESMVVLCAESAIINQFPWLELLDDDLVTRIERKAEESLSP